jgi:membrane dipeptidase
MNLATLPVFDLHCDLLSYMAKQPHADVFNLEHIGCAIPHLQNGNVRLQVLAVFSKGDQGSIQLADKQLAIYQQLLRDYSEYLVEVTDLATLQQLPTYHKTGVVLAIENASCICSETDNLEVAFQKMNEIQEKTEKILYISLTHQAENRFGGGDHTQAGLKADGKVFLEFLNGKHIAIDLSHTSDALAHDILDYTYQKSLAIPVLASHSNFRAVSNHARNLPDEIVMEIVKRHGLIGFNFLRAYIHDTNPDALFEHFDYAVKLGAEDCLCFGADYYYTAGNPDKTRIPFYFKEHENASQYSSILENFKSKGVSEKSLHHLAYQNALNFMMRVWG